MLSPTNASGLARCRAIITRLSDTSDDVRICPAIAPTIDDIATGNHGDVTRFAIAQRQAVEVTAIFHRQFADERRSPKRLKTVLNAKGR